MVVDDNISTLLEEWNHCFPPRHFPPYKFKTDDHASNLPPRVAQKLTLDRTGTSMLYRGSDRGNDRLEQMNRTKRGPKIYTTFCDYLIFQMVRKRLCTVGFPMDKLQESNRGKISRISLGLDIPTECVWWDHGLHRSFLRFRDVLRVD